MKEFQCKHCGKRFETSDAMKQHISDAHKSPTNDIKVKGRSKKNVFTYAIIGLIVVGIAYGIYSMATSSGNHIGPIGSTHQHIDFKLYINGNIVDLSQPKYQLRAQYVHVEGGDGDVVHKHATGVTIGDFLKTLGISFTKDCIKMDDGKQYCNGKDGTVKFYVNRKPDNRFQNYELTDLDKVFVSFGNETPDQLQKELNSITSKAAKESGKDMPIGA